MTPAVQLTCKNGVSRETVDRMQEMSGEKDQGELNIFSDGLYDSGWTAPACCLSFVLTLVTYVSSLGYQCEHASYAGYRFQKRKCYD